LVMNSKVILAVGAHPDDIELGCGGTLYKVSKRGTKVVAIFLTKGEKSGYAEVRKKESIAALNTLGVAEVHFGDFPDTELPISFEAIDFLEQFSYKYDPDMVLTHTVHDTHQDHRQVGWLSISAFRNVPKVLSYETPRVRPSTYSPTYFVDISNCLEKKWAALECHVTQKAKRYLAYESMINLASFRGNQVNVRAAEAYEVVKYLEK